MTPAAIVSVQSSTESVSATTTTTLPTQPSTLDYQSTEPDKELHQVMLDGLVTPSPATTLPASASPSSLTVDESSTPTSSNSEPQATDTVVKTTPTSIVAGVVVNKAEMQSFEEWKEMKLKDATASATQPSNNNGQQSQQQQHAQQTQQPSSSESTTNTQSWVFKLFDGI